MDLKSFKLDADDRMLEVLKGVIARRGPKKTRRGLKV
jgi:hypothetical protein